MDENKSSKLAEIDELLERTAPENRMLFNKDNTEPIEPDKDFIHHDDNQQDENPSVNEAANNYEDVSSDTSEMKDASEKSTEEDDEIPVNDTVISEEKIDLSAEDDSDLADESAIEAVQEETVAENNDTDSEDFTPPAAIDVKPVVNTENAVTEEDADEEDEPAGICIIDETSTDVVFEEGPELAMDEITEAPAKKKEKKIKEKIKFNALQIVLIVVVSLVTLWTLVYTVDHTLASNGFSPLFYFSEKIYPDESVSYKCLGYKIQFMFDANGNVTQDTLPAWKDGPNDIRFEDEFKNSANFN